MYELVCKICALLIFIAVIAFIINLLIYFFAVVGSLCITFINLDLAGLLSLCVGILLGILLWLYVVNEH